MPFTLPLPSAIARADALEQVPPVILLAPGITDSVGCLSVLIIAPVCVGKKAFRYVSQVKFVKCSSETQIMNIVKLGKLFFDDRFILSYGAKHIKLPKDGITCATEERELYDLVQFHFPVCQNTFFFFFMIFHSLFSIVFNIVPLTKFTLWLSISLLFHSQALPVITVYDLSFNRGLSLEKQKQ